MPPCLLLIFFLLLPWPLYAAGLSAVNATIPLEKAWNPWPDATDILLPMPCEGHLVLRAVAVPVKGILYDKTMTMGLTNTPSERHIYERRYDGHISAPFAVGDVPLSWRPAIEKAGGGYMYYFMAKYEISQWQWDAIMGGQCPPMTITAKEASPKTGVTWIDVQQFLFKYTEWLLYNAKATLPIFAHNDKDIAYVRLPTEPEWEYAARGGMNVPEEHRNQEDMYPLKDYAAQGKTEPEQGEWVLGDFAIYQGGQGAGAAHPLGSRKPNPLLLYDMGGNVREMVQGPFHFTIAEQQGGVLQQRLHGSAGGYVSKGGSFLTGETSILPGSRDEVPYFQEGGAYKARDLGFRLVVSGINTPASASRMGQLVAEAAAMTQYAVAPTAPPASDSSEKIDTRGTLLSELDKLSKGAEKDTQKKNFAQYRAMVADTLASLDRQQEEVVLGTLRSALYQAEGLRNTAFRILRGERDLDDELRQLQTATTKDSKGGVSELESKKQQERAKNVMQNFVNALHSSTNNYKQDVERLRKAPEATLLRNLAVLRKEYSGNGYLEKHMQENLLALEKHLQHARKHGIHSLTKAQLWGDIIPAPLRVSRGCRQ